MRTPWALCTEVSCAMSQIRQWEWRSHRPSKDDESFTTINLTINFFRSVWKERLRAEARVINRGKNVGYVERAITSNDGKQVAKATSTCFALRGEQWKQR